MTHLNSFIIFYAFNILWRKREKNSVSFNFSPPSFASTHVKTNKFSVQSQPLSSCVEVKCLSSRNPLLTVSIASLFTWFWPLFTRVSLIFSLQTESQVICDIHLQVCLLRHLPLLLVSVVCIFQRHRHTHSKVMNQRPSLIDRARASFFCLFSFHSFVLSVFLSAFSCFPCHSSVSSSLIIAQVMRMKMWLTPRFFFSL